MTTASWTVLVETKRADGTTERIEIAALERDIMARAARGRQLLPFHAIHGLDALQSIRGSSE